MNGGSYLAASFSVTGQKKKSNSSELSTGVSVRFANDGGADFLL